MSWAAPPGPAGQGRGQGQVTIHRVGAGQPMAADSAFGVALVGLWHAAAGLGEGSLGFVPPVLRSDVAAVAAQVVDRLRGGTSEGIALVKDRRMVGFGVLRRNPGLESHTGEIAKVMVHPDLARQGLGSTLMTSLLELARKIGLDRLDLSVRDGQGLAEFYRRFGFVEWGRRPGWIRVGPDDDRDEVFLYLLLH